MNKTTDPSGLHGSCLCGQVAYKINPPFHKMVHCHCQRCRKATGTGHATNIIADPAQLEWLSGEEQIVRYDLPTAKSFGKWFCGQCGSPMPRPSRDGERMIIPAGSLDEEPPIDPGYRIFWGSRASWSCFDGELSTHEEYPDSWQSDPDWHSIPGAITYCIGSSCMVEKRKFDSFSRKQIAEMASEAGLRARKESLEAGLEVLSQNPETGEFICERLDAEGNLIKRKPTREEIEALKRQRPRAWILLKVGGFTTLAFYDTFATGASYWGIDDLEALAGKSHKFESRYLDTLVGPYPEKKEVYKRRR